MNGIELIAAERQRQIGKKGWSREHDDWHIAGELTDAAECYLHHANMLEQLIKPSYNMNGAPSEWPWQACWWKPSDDVVRNLVKAGALIAAEIDRLQHKRA